MNEQWVIDKLKSASEGDGKIPVDPDSAVQSFYIGIPGDATWGNITGNLNDQTDLATALNGKINKDSNSPDIKFGCDGNGLFVDVEETA